MIAGSSSVLAADTIGFSTVGGERDVRFESVGDADAYLGLTAGGVEDDGPLFDGGPRRPPAVFDVVNGLPEPIAIAIVVDGLRFVSVAGAAVSDDRFVAGVTDGNRLGPGERIENVTVGVPSRNDEPGGDATGTVRIEADGDETRIVAERELTLERPDIGVETARLALSRPDADRIAHEWRLRGVDTDGVPLERLRFEYDDIETADALDFTAADGPSVSVAVDESEYAASIERRSATALEAALASPVVLDGEPIRIVLTDTGPPASLGGGGGSPSGATLELIGRGTSVRVDGVRRRS